LQDAQVMKYQNHWEWNIVVVVVVAATNVVMVVVVVHEMENGTKLNQFN